MGVEDGGWECVERAEQDDGVDVLAVEELEPATNPGDATAFAYGEPDVGRVKVQFDLTHERRREGVRGDDVDALVDRWEVGR